MQDETDVEPATMKNTPLAGLVGFAPCALFSDAVQAMVGRNYLFCVIRF